MTIGVLMPCRAPLPFVEAAVRSVLCQTHRDFHLVIVNDGSPPEVKEYLEGLKEGRVQVLHQAQSLGVSQSLNRGLELLETEWVFRMDADDVALPERFSRQVAAIGRDPDLDVLGSNMQAMDRSQKKKVAQSLPLEHSAIAYRLCWSNALNHPTVAFRRELVLEAGGYNNTLKFGQDYELWTRLIFRGKFANLPERLLQYRIHNGQNSLQPFAEKEKVRRQIRSRYHQALCGVSYSPLFDQPQLWNATLQPTSLEWDQWLEFIESLCRQMSCGPLGQEQGAPFCARRDLARRLWRSVQGALMGGGAFPEEALKLLPRLSWFYSLSKGVLFRKQAWAVAGLLQSNLL